jgi:hypothetical protein
MELLASDLTYQFQSANLGGTGFLLLGPLSTGIGSPTFLGSEDRCYAPKRLACDRPGYEKTLPVLISKRNSLPSPYTSPVEQDSRRFMPRIVVFPNSDFREPQPIFDFVPFIVGIPEPISSLAARALYSQLVFEIVRYSGFTVNDFCEGRGHFPTTCG